MTQPRRLSALDYLEAIYEMAEENQKELVPQAPGSVADELGKLDRLRDDGVISTEEFEAQKARLLKRH